MGLLNEQFENASVSQLIRWWNGEETPDWAKTTSLVYEKLGVALRKAGPEGVRFLKSQVRSPDYIIRAKALSALARKEVCDEEIIQLLTEAFRNTQDMEPGVAFGFKEITLHGFVTVEKYPLKRGEVEPLLECDYGWTAANAMIYLCHAFPDEAVEILKAGLRSDNPTIRGTACSEAGFIKIWELRQDIEALLNDLDEFVSRSAQIACELFAVAERHYKHF